MLYYIMSHLIPNELHEKLIELSNELVKIWQNITLDVWFWNVIFDFTHKPDKKITETNPITKETIKEDRNELLEKLVKYLCENHHPHTKIIIECDHWEIVEWSEWMKVTKFIRD